MSIRVADLPERYRAQVQEQIDAQPGRAEIEPPARGHKYGAQASASALPFPELEGRRFPSKLERRRAEILVTMQRAGEISGLEFQPRVELTRARLSYRPDFAYRESSGRLVYEEVKGMEGTRWRLVARLWKVYGPAPLHVYKQTENGIACDRTIEPDPKRGEHGQDNE